MDVLRTLAASAIYVFAGFRQIRSAVDACLPVSESEEESDRAGRLGELEVAALFQGISGVSVYPSLRIPDSEHKVRREIDLVLLTKKKIYVIEIKNWSGTVNIISDGRWCQIRRNGTRNILPDVVEDTKYRAALLEAYIFRRGVQLPPGSIEYKVFLINPQCRPVDEIVYQPEVLTSEQWGNFLKKDLDPEGWLQRLFPNLNKDPVHEQLKYILNTAPTWDKLYLEGGRIVVGDFIRFNGRDEDMQSVQLIKRSNTCYVEMQHVRSWLQNILGLLVGMRPEVKLICKGRDVRESGRFLKRKNVDKVTEAIVRPDFQVVFRVVGTSRAEVFLANNVCSLSLSI